MNTKINLGDKIDLVASYRYEIMRYCTRTKYILLYIVLHEMNAYMHY